MKSQDQKLILGNLDLQVAFRLPGAETTYRTITHPPKPASPGYGARECLNLTTNKAEKLACKKEVSTWNVNTELSKNTE
jgi:hypothetical protein